LGLSDASQIEPQPPFLALAHRLEIRRGLRFRRGGEAAGRVGIGGLGQPF